MTIRGKLPRSILCAAAAGAALAGAAGCVFEDPGGPLVDYWLETGRIDCETNEVRDIDAVPIEELKIEAGQLFVTWSPFEVGYYDYVAEYVADIDEGSMELSSTAPKGIDVPSDVDGTGELTLSDDMSTLTLEEFWLGTPPVDEPETNYPRRCGHVFRRAGPARDGR